MGVYKKHLWMATSGQEKFGTKLFAIKGKVRQIESLQRTMKSLCNKQHCFGKHVKFVNAAAHDDHQRLVELIDRHVVEEDKQTAISIVDVTIAALEHSASVNLEDSIRDWIVQESGILGLEYTDSTPHSGRVLAIVYEQELAAKQQQLDVVLDKAYSNKIPKEEQFLFNGRMTAKCNGVTRAHPAHDHIQRPPMLMSRQTKHNTHQKRHQK